MPVRRAHFIPRAYLRGFLCDEKKEKTYAFNSKSELITRTKIDAICTKNFLYRTQDANGSDSDDIEEALSQIEDKYAGWLNKVRSKKPLANSDVADLAIFIALQHLRVPRSFDFTNDMASKTAEEMLKAEIAKLLKNKKRREELMHELRESNPARFEKLLKEDSTFTGRLTRKNVETMISRTRLDFDLGQNNIIRNMFESTEFVANMILERGWNFVFAPVGSEFITSDMPVYVAKLLPNGVLHFGYGGFGQPDADVVFPLAKDVCLIARGSNYYQNFSVISAETVVFINKITATHPNLQYLIASSKVLVEDNLQYFKLPKQTIT